MLNAVSIYIFYHDYLPSGFESKNKKLWGGVWEKNLLYMLCYAECMKVSI